ncbi:hypothetical protein LCGC14_2288420 [marine sediment metagenome]|uniref:Uncharacterized protein n=1 Tax=marine sediment metagenome TaxID=412755 RepID=A0A0F9CSG8_9ZZZZ
MKASVVKVAISAITPCDDGSILLEMAGRDFRFGVCFDKNEKDTTWFFVSKPECELGERSMSGYFVEAEEV